MTTNLPKITVITATFNLIKDKREKFFRQCVESVHNQTYPNIEHIVIDAASKDGTLDLIKEYEDKGWLKCYSEPDKGMWEGMNKGIKKATGKYVCFLNSDDFYTNDDVLELSVKKLEETQSDYCYAPFDVIKRENDEFVIHCNFLPVERFFMGMTYNHETLVCKKSVYEELGYHNEKYRTTIDYAFNISLVLNDYKHTHINKTMITARLGGATTGNDGKCSKETLENIDKLYADVFDFYKFGEGSCRIMFLENIYPPYFLQTLKHIIFGKELKNFNYLFFLDYVNEAQKMNDKKWSNLIDSSNCANFSYKRKIKINLFGFIRFNVVKTQYKNTYYIFRIPIMTAKIKEKFILYKLFNFIPLLKIKG